MTRAFAAALLFLLVGCTSEPEPPRNVPPTIARFNGTYPVSLTLNSSPTTSVGICDSHLDRTLTITNGVVKMVWNSVRAIDLDGSIGSDGTFSATASYLDFSASMTGKVDPDRHSLTGTVNSNGCIYSMGLAS